MYTRRLRERARRKRISRDYYLVPDFFVALRKERPVQKKKTVRQEKYVNLIISFASSLTSLYLQRTQGIVAEVHPVSHAPGVWHSGVQFSETRWAAVANQGAPQVPEEWNHAERGVHSLWAAAHPSPDLEQTCKISNFFFALTLLRSVTLGSLSQWGCLVSLFCLFYVT